MYFFYFFALYHLLHREQRHSSSHITFQHHFEKAVPTSLCCLTLFNINLGSPHRVQTAAKSPELTSTVINSAMNNNNNDHREVDLLLKYSKLHTVEIKYCTMKKETHQFI